MVLFVEMLINLIFWYDLIIIDKVKKNLMNLFGINLLCDYKLEIFIGFFLLFILNKINFNFVIIINIIVIILIKVN